jgi:hypothetical protein
MIQHASYTSLKFLIAGKQQNPQLSDEKEIEKKRPATVEELYGNFFCYMFMQGLTKKTF